MSWEARESIIILTPRQVEGHKRSLEVVKAMLQDMLERLGDSVPGPTTKKRIADLEGQVRHHEGMLREGGYIHDNTGTAGIEHTMPPTLWKINQQLAEKQHEPVPAEEPAAFEMAQYSVNQHGQLELVFPDLPASLTRGSLKSRLKGLNAGKKSI